MTFTFDPDMITSRDQIRTLIGDTNPNRPKLSDAQIAFIATNEGGNLYDVAAACAEALAAAAAGKVDKHVGSMSLSSSQEFQHYQELAMNYREKSAIMFGAAPYVGGISQADKDKNRSNSDRIETTFTKDQFDMPSLYPPAGGRRTWGW